MSFDTDIAKAELYRQIDLANAALTDAERSIRYQRRRLFAELNNAGSVDGAFAALQSCYAFCSLECRHAAALRHFRRVVG